MLVEPSFAGELMPDLIGLTAGEASSNTRILLLGATEASPPRVGRIATATRRSVTQALAHRPGTETTPPEMNLRELRDALSGCMIEARYQPVVCLRDARLLGIEALARLNHPERGTLAPDLFVPQLEAAGLGQELTAAVAARAFADMARLPGFARHSFLALNFPLDVMMGPEVLERLDAARAQAGLEPGRVLLELTESRPVADFAGLNAAITRLRRAGYQVAIDDVGPAVPHHQAMMEMPFTAMKLDRSVVQVCGREAEACGFVRRTISFARRWASW